MGTCASIQSPTEKPSLEFPFKNLEDKRKSVLEKILLEPEVVDLKLTFYMAACEAFSDGHDLIPSPKEYLKKRPLKETLQEVNASIPNVNLLRLYLEKPGMFQLSEEVLTVLYWLLIRLKEPHLLPIKDQDYWPQFSIQDDSPAGDSMRSPDMLLKVCYSTMSTKYAQWKSITYGKKTMLAFTAVPLEDVHSALHCGTERLIKPGKYGSRLCLCSRLSGCFHKSKSAWTWGKSCLGTQMTVVMIVEFADSSQSVLKLGHNKPAYYLIPDKHYARIRYLLIWINAPPAERPRLAISSDKQLNFHYLVSSFILISSLFFPKEAPNLLQNGMIKLTSLREKIMKHN